MNPMKFHCIIIIIGFDKIYYKTKLQTKPCSKLGFGSDVGEQNIYDAMKL